MDENERNVKHDAATLPPSRPIPFDLRLRSLKCSRQTLARILRSWARGEIDESTAKTGTWLFSMYLGYLKAGLEEDIEWQLKKLENRVKQIEKEKTYGDQAAIRRTG